MLIEHTFGDQGGNHAALYIRRMAGRDADKALFGGLVLMGVIAALVVVAAALLLVLGVPS